MWIYFCSFTFVGSINYDLELKSDYSMEIILYALVTLYLSYLFYLFKILRHYPGLFQSNQNIPLSFNQRPVFYGTILISQLNDQVHV